MLAQELHRIFVHARWPVQSYVLAGFLFGMALGQAPPAGRTVLAFFAWLLLCVGLTVFNSYYDRDEAPVGGMRHPPRVSRSLLWGSLTLELVALALAWFVNRFFFALAVAMAVVYICYSHRLTRWKANGFVAVLLNSLLGFMTILAAGSLGGGPLAPPVLLGGLTAALFKASVYMMMQVHQIDEDRRRGDRSIAVLFGRDATLRASLVAMVLAGAAAALTLRLATGRLLLPLVSIPYFAAMVLLFLWWLRQRADVEQDLSIMTRMVHLTGYLGSVMSVIVYAVSTLVGYPEA
jgi:1,4-dihydroxy-2-naphthoate octaprenyltransferase